MTAAPERRVAILGTRGVPARHGGFETFAARLAPYLVDAGWHVTVYCQIDPDDPTPREDAWQGVRRVNLRGRSASALGTMEFDLKAVAHAAKEPGVKLVLGYNTAVFNLGLRLAGRRVVMNMDGIEWRRSKWSLPARAWLRLNEYAGLVTSHHLVADHPEIAAHLRATLDRAPITMIPYGADVADAGKLPVPAIAGLGTEPYFVVVARVEPENSILEMVQAFVQARLEAKLVVLGTLDPPANPYHAQVLAAANENCVFPGAIYDQEIVEALRYWSVAYLHGHTVGGTNPSLVEALGVGAAVIAHDNPFNRWVAGDGALYFSDVESCRAAMTELIESPARREQLRSASSRRHAEAFTWPSVLNAYEQLLASQLEPEGV